MDVFKRIFDYDKSQRAAHAASVTGHRNQIQSWISEHLSQLHEAAKQAGGRIGFRTFSSLQGGTDQDVDLVGTAQMPVDYEMKRMFDVGISWRASDHENVKFFAGQTVEFVQVEEAIGASPLGPLGRVLAGELERLRG